MQQLKENILEAILNKSDVKIKEDFYISYQDVKQIIEKYFEGFRKIIVEKNLQEDFIEGLVNLLNREMTSEEIEKLANSGILDECLDQMFEKESEIIIDYCGANFTNE